MAHARVSVVRIDVKVEKKIFLKFLSLLSLLNEVAEIKMAAALYLPGAEIRAKVNNGSKCQVHRRSSQACVLSIF